MNKFMQEGIEYQRWFELTQPMFPVNHTFLRDLEGSCRGIEAHPFSSCRQHANDAAQRRCQPCNRRSKGFAVVDITATAMVDSPTAMGLSLVARMNMNRFTCAAGTRVGKQIHSTTMGNLYPPYYRLSYTH